MNRKDFIKLCGIYGIGLPLHSSLASCNNDGSGETEFKGKVVIIGAGAGGLSSGYLLNQRGIDFEILEASSSYGGRMRINTDFADFPIPVGAEWLHSSTDVFQEMVNDGSVNVDVNTINYDGKQDTYAFWDNGQLSVSPLNDSDIKFVDYSWFNFYEDYIIPDITDKIAFNTIVESVDYSDQKIRITTNQGEVESDKIIVSVPLKILQDGDIIFIPGFPDDKMSAVNSSKVWEGFKAFIEFSDKFYDTQIGFNIIPATEGQKLYYDAAYGQNTSKNILGLFSVGRPALNYSKLSDSELIGVILTELDEIYEGKASRSYINYITQDWNKEPFIRSGYLSDETDWRMVRKLSESIDRKIYFAGGPYTNGEDWVSIHAAAQSAKSAIDELTS